MDNYMKIKGGMNGWMVGVVNGWMRIIAITFIEGLLGISNCFKY